MFAQYNIPDFVIDPWFIITVDNFSDDREVTVYNVLETFIERIYLFLAGVFVVNTSPVCR